jgi:cytochrome c biogenesis protein
MYGALTGFEARDRGYAGTGFSVPEGRFRADISKVVLEYPDGPNVRPRAVSDVTITRNGQIIREGRISINYPLRFEGISIYHSTFLWVPHLTVTNPDTGVTEGPVKLYDRDRYFYRDRELYIHTLAFFSDFSMNHQGMPITRSYAATRPVLAYRIGYPGGTSEQWALLELNKPVVVETKNGPLELTMVGFENAAVYSVAKNLGRPYLFTGSLLLVIGLYMSFFLFPRRVYVTFDTKTSTYLVGARSRNKPDLEQLMDRIEEEISKSGRE